MSIKNLAAAGTLGLVSLMTFPTVALADSGHTYARTCCDPGGASASGDVHFYSSQHVTITNAKLNDLCPADGHNVYVRFEYMNWGFIWMERGEKRWNREGCANPRPITVQSFDFRTSGENTIVAVRLKVCVDERWQGDDCATSIPERYNPYH